MLLEIGTIFYHCNIKLTVIGHTWSNSLDMILPGLLCHYYVHGVGIKEIFLRQDAYTDYLYNENAVAK